MHLAAIPSVPRSLEDPLASHAANATGTLEVLEAARRHGVGHVIVASSSSVYGANLVLPKHEGLCAEPMSPYAVSKLATEGYALAYRQCFGLSVLALRFFNVFGPLQPAGHAYAAVVPVFIDAALSNRPIPVNGDGTQSRDFTFIGSVTSVITDAVLRQVCASGPVNLAFGTRTTVLGLIDELEKVLGCRLPRVHRPPRAGDVPHSQADSSRLATLFPRLEPVSLPDGLRATVDWFRSTMPVSPGGGPAANDDEAGSNILSDHGPGPDEAASPDGEPVEHDRVAADGDVCGEVHRAGHVAPGYTDTRSSKVASSPTVAL